MSTTVIEVESALPNTWVLSQHYGCRSVLVLASFTSFSRVGREEQAIYAILVANPKTDSGKQRMKS